MIRFWALRMQGTRGLKHVNNLDLSLTIRFGRVGGTLTLALYTVSRLDGEHVHVTGVCFMLTDV